MWRDPGLTLLVVGFTFTAISTLVVALRLYSRHIQMHIAGVSDYIMLFALLSTWITTVVNYYQTRFGKGAIFSKVQKNPNSPQIQAAVSGTLITWFIYRPLYIFTLSLVKLSILAFYRTLVLASSTFRSFRYTVNALIIFTVIYSLSIIAASIFQCTPISAAYAVSASYSQTLGHSKFPKPRCHDPNVIWVSIALINFATDVFIFLLPIPIIISLRRMPLRKKVQLFCIFSIGTLAIVASCVRMWILVIWAKNVRSRGKYGTDLLTWGLVEVNCGIVSASAMFLRPVIRQCFGRRAAKSEGVDPRARDPERVDPKDPEVREAALDDIPSPAKSYSGPKIETY